MLLNHVDIAGVPSAVRASVFGDNLQGMAGGSGKFFCIFGYTILVHYFIYTSMYPTISPFIIHVLLCFDNIVATLTPLFL
jgi:hypothetical protein